MVSNRSVDQILRSFTNFWLPPYKRWNGKWFNPVPSASWEIALSPRETKFYLTVPTAWLTVVEKQISTTWPRSTVTKTVEPLRRWKHPTVVGQLELAKHYMFRLHLDARTDLIGSLLDCLKMMNKDEQAYIQVLMTPASPEWSTWGSVCYEEYRKGKMPKRLKIDSAGALNLALTGMANILEETVSLVQDFANVKPEINMNLESVKALSDSPLGSSIPNKLKEDAFEVTIRIGITANQPRATALLRSIAMAFRCMDGDNSLQLVDCNCAKSFQLMKQRQHGLKWNHDYLSISELAKVIQLPSGSMQIMHKLISVQYRESDLPRIITKEGLKMGTSTYHGSKVNVYIPTNDIDELCLPRVVLGMMGSGKTSFGAVLAIEAVKNGYTVVTIDPAKGEMGNEIELGLPRDKIIRVRFGVQPIALDWREALHSERSRNRMANELVSYCEASTDSAGAQTVRYLRASAKAIPSTRLSDVIKLFTDDEYRQSLIPTMREAEATLWNTFNGFSESRRTQISEPIFNRLDVVTGDDYLLDCLNCADGLDFVDLLDGEPKAIVIDLPKKDLGEEALDVLGALISTKLNLAMFLRTSTHPVFVIQDEPHSYVRSTRTWKNVAVESRKWRFCYIWMLHTLEQFPSEFRNIVLAAGPHYHIYTTSKNTYKFLAEELDPFTIEECMKTPRHWAIHCIRADGDMLPPFLVEMEAPPSVKMKKSK